MALIIVGAVTLAYSNCFSVPFILDDAANIGGNATIRDLSNLGRVLAPPANLGVGGRPLTNLAFAVCHALGGGTVTVYHGFNVLVHAMACLSLFGVVRRTLRLPGISGRLAPRADGIALLAVLFWGLHPLQTESITYVSQGSEAMMGLFFLQTLYCFIRASLSDGWARVGWSALAAAACLAGMATKEVMVTAPVAVLLYDAVILSRSSRVSLRERLPLHVLLFCSWGLLAVQLGGLSRRDVGFDTGISSWVNALTECRAVATCLRLSVWPHPLVFFRDAIFVHDPLQVLLPGSVLTVLLFWALAALIRRSAAGFAAAFTFLVLAPTSSVVPIIRQPVAEHRMYLPLAGVAVLAAAGLYALAGRRAVLFGGSAVLALGVATWVRNLDYRSEVSIWADTVAKEPRNSAAENNLGLAYQSLGRYEEALEAHRAAIRDNPRNERAHNGLGSALAALGQQKEAAAEFSQALQIDPNLAAARNNLGASLYCMGRLAESIPQFREAIRVVPDYIAAHNNLGVALADSGRLEEAIAESETVLKIDPRNLEALNNLGADLLHSGRAADGAARLRELVRIKPDHAHGWFNLGLCLESLGRPTDAAEAYRSAIRAKPDYAEARNNLGNILLDAGSVSEATEQYLEAIRVAPGYVEARLNFGAALERQRLPSEAAVQYREVIKRDPSNPKAHYRLGNALSALGRREEALAEYAQATALVPGDAMAHNNLGAMLFLTGKTQEAAAQFREAIKLDPSCVDAHRNLGIVLESEGRREEARAEVETVSRLTKGK